MKLIFKLPYAEDLESQESTLRYCSSLMVNASNRLRAFADVVSLDAWHEDFVENNFRAKLYADVGFRTARVGSEVVCPVRFRLSLRRAEIHLILPESEPLWIDPKTVARTVVEEPRKRSITTESAKETSKASKLGFIGSISGAAFKLQTDKNKSDGSKATLKQKVEENRRDFNIRVTCTKTSDENYRWEVESTDRRQLSGAAWDPEISRATLVDTGERSKYGLVPGGVRFEACCAREDLIIEDVEIKDPSLWERLKQSAFPATKEMVVIQYIKNELIKEELEAREIEDKFGLLTLASIIAEG